MRMMLRAVIDTASGNSVIEDGSIGQLIGQMVDRLQPEAAYFTGEDGQRACFMVFDMQDSADLPAISEPLFQSGNARVTISPCMNLEDLQKGLARLQGAAAAPAGDDAARTSAGVG